MTRSARVAVALALTALLAACGSAPVLAGREPASGDDLSGELTVFAAASLADAFDDIADAFEAAHPDVRVRFNAAGSHTLARQIVQGAPADVYASADATQMRILEDAGSLAGPPARFAGNVLAIAVEPGNPIGIRGLDDLEGPDLLVVLPAEEVPAGAYARQVLDVAGVTVVPASLADDVRGALATVIAGEADAALVYASDIVAAGDRVDGVSIPEETNASADYLIAALAGSANPHAAREFGDFVRARQARAILADHGFSPP